MWKTGCKMVGNITNKNDSVEIYIKNLNIETLEKITNLFLKKIIMCHLYNKCKY